MDPALKTMIANLPANTGKSLEEWLAVVQEAGVDKHGEIMALLKGKHAVTHGYANLVSQYARAKDGPAEESLVDLQYAKKPALRPLYDALMASVSDLECELLPKKTAVALKRKKQFLYVEPKTKTRLDVGIQLKGEPATPRLKARSGMTSHVVGVTQLSDIDDELKAWIRLAWERCG